MTRNPADCSRSLESILKDGPKPVASTSRAMAAIPSKNTKTEIALRKALFAAGLRYRLDAPMLSCKPDIVFPRAKVAIFVHGCFWHQHDVCKQARTPKSRAAFWSEKFRRNRSRDVRTVKDLRIANWTPIIVWECELKHAKRLSEIITETAEFLVTSSRF